MAKPKDANRDTMTDEEFLAAVRQKPNPVAVRELIFEISRAMATREDNGRYKGISWAEEIE